MERAYMFAFEGWVGGCELVPGKALPKCVGFIDYTDPGWQPHMIGADLWVGTAENGAFTPEKILRSL